MQKVKQVAIVANGAMSDYEHFRRIIESSDVVIAADGGLKHLEKIDVSPTLMLGDFDSIDSLGYYKKRFPLAAVETFEVRKDYTDSELAVRRALDYQPESIVLLAMTGTRLDHTLANVSLLKLIYDAGIQGVLKNEQNDIVYTEQSMFLEGQKGQLMSLVPLSEEVTGITLKGFEYPLEEATLPFGSTTGVSNVFASTEGEIRIKQGRLLVLKSRD